MAPPAISIRQLNHHFGRGPLRRQILFDITADIHPGEIVITTGPSGSGKTTMLTLVCGLRSVQDGSVKTLGTELRGAGKEVLVGVRRSIGFIFQAHNLLGALSARQNVEMSVALDRSVTPAESRERARHVLTAVGLEDRMDHYPHQLSGGQKQRVAIARALVRRPRIILADEPTASLDKASGREVVDLLQELARKQGCAILLVTHDNRILDVADRILTLEDGRMSSFASGIRADAGNLLGAFAQMHRRGELKRHLEGLADDAFARELGEATSEFEQVLETLDVANAEATWALLDQVLEVVADRIRQLLRADRTSVFLVDHQRGGLHSKLAHHTGAEPLEITLPSGVGIAGRVAQTGAWMNVADPYTHPDFNPEIDRRSGYRTRSILCAPIADRAGRVIGVVQVLNKLDEDTFGAADEQALQALAPAIGIILETCCRLLPAARHVASAPTERRPPRSR